MKQIKYLVQIILSMTYPWIYCQIIFIPLASAFMQIAKLPHWMYIFIVVLTFLLIQGIFLLTSFIRAYMNKPFLWIIKNNTISKALSYGGLVFYSGLIIIEAWGGMPDNTFDIVNYSIITILYIITIIYSIDVIMLSERFADKN